MDNKTQSLPASFPESNQEQPPPPYTSVASAEHPTQSSTLSPSQLSHPTENSPTSLPPSTLPRPIAIPATSPKPGSPFLRAYPPHLNQFALPRETFLRFLDDLNRIAVQSPPLQVLSLAGNIVGFVPIATAQIVGSAVSAAATISNRAISYGRTEIYLRQANKDIFAPRGLKAEIAKLDALAKVAELPILDSEDKVRKDTPLLVPIDDLEANQSMSGHDRRLAALEPWIARLDLSPLPEIQSSSNPLSKLNVAASERMRRKGEEDMRKSRTKAHEEFVKESAKARKDYEKEMAKLEKETKKAQREKSPDKIEKELAKIEKERTKVEREYEKDMREIEKDRMDDDKEEKHMRKILWLIVRTLDADSGPGPDPYIDGIA